MFKKLLLTTAAAVVLSVSGAYAETNIRMAIALQLTSHFGTFGQAFKKSVERLSAGEIKVDLHPMYQGANERAAVEAVQIGALDATLNGTAVTSGFVPEVGVFDIPYLFRDEAHLEAVMDGPIGAEILGHFEEKGLIGLGYYSAGIRGVTNNQRPVRTPEDIRNLKLRTQQSEEYLAAFKALGALPTPMAFSELITALQTGVLDGQENAVLVMVPTRLYEVQKYYSLTDHAMTPLVFMLSADKWNSLSDQEKEWVKQASQEAVKFTRKWIAEQSDAGMKLMKDAGLQVNDDVDLAAFRDAVQPAYVEFEKKFGKDLLDRIKSVQ